jgi:hypothetical protein
MGETEQAADGDASKSEAQMDQGSEGDADRSLSDEESALSDVPESEHWRPEFRREVLDMLFEGWEIEEAHRDRVEMVDRDYGSFSNHCLVLGSTAWITFGFGNVAYALYRYFYKADHKLIWDAATSSNSSRRATERV